MRNPISPDACGFATRQITPSEFPRTNLLSFWHSSTSACILQMQHRLTFWVNQVCRRCDRLAAVVLVSAAMGCGAGTGSTSDDPLRMMETGNEECGDTVEFAFDNGVTEADLDKAIGPRLERYEIVYGPRVRIEGTARRGRRPRVDVDSDNPYSIILLGGLEWPAAVENRHVVVEGCLSRTYYPWEASHPDTSKWTERERLTRNNLHALPFGFVYGLRDFAYRLSENNGRGEDKNETMAPVNPPNAESDGESERN
jgi:hypothetical protein